MKATLRTEAKRYQPYWNGIAIPEMLRLFQDCRTPGRSRLVGRIQDEARGYRWTEHSVTSVGVLASGDLLMSLRPVVDSLSDMAPMRLDDLITIFGHAVQNVKSSLLFATMDGGETMFVCQGVYVADADGTKSYLTFVPANALPAETPAQLSH